MELPGRSRGASGAAPWVALAVALSLAGCNSARDLGEGEGMHLTGWADLDHKDADAFHAKWLQARRKDHGDEAKQIALCRQCHGEDYAGGATGVSCTTKGCHTQKGGPEFCGTCHGSKDGPMPVDPQDPVTGAHARHQDFCAECHVVPTKLDSPNHLDNKVDVIFSGHAALKGAKPSFDATALTCADVYCHGDKKADLKWQAPPDATTPCDLCHKLAPDTHVRWARVANATDALDVAKMACDQCHPKPQKPRPDNTHIDGQLQLSPMTCWACHGTAPTGAPGPSLTGDTEPTSPRVGAHQRHVDAGLSGRVGRVATCEQCHKVPQQVFEANHFGLLGQPVDTTPSVEVSLWLGGTYTPQGTDPATSQTCVVACHWNNGEPGSVKPAPQWTKDQAGMTPACNFCHDFPPKYLREGSPHTQAPAQLDACKACHPFTPDTHVDGKVDLLTGAQQ